MAVQCVSTFRIAPGKFSEFMEEVRRARVLHESLGGQVRFFQAQFAGTLSGTFCYFIELEDLNAFASLIAGQRESEEWQRAEERIFRAAEPLAIEVSCSLLDEIAFGEM